jgi:membrane associated rhomboid family serine protease
MTDNTKYNLFSSQSGENSYEMSTPILSKHEISNARLMADENSAGVTTITIQPDYEVNATTPTTMDEIQRYIQIISNAFRPSQQEHQLIWLPIIVSILTCIFFVTMVLTPQYCLPPYYETVCTDMLAQITFGGFYVGNATIPSARWITYSFYHFNWLHISTNMIMLVGSLYFMEKKYGSMRMAFLYAVGSVGGALFGWMILPTDALLAGASAAIYGYIFLYLADLILNWYTVNMPRTEIMLVVSGIISLVVEEVFNVDLSTCAHIGGGLATLWFSLLILPRFYHQKYEFVIVIVAIICIILQFVVLPAILYKVKP